MNFSRLIIGLLAAAGLILAMTGLAAQTQPGQPQAGTPAAPPAGAAPQSQVFLTETEFDFGLVKPEAKLTHDFQVQNKGQADLIIESVNPG
ncbi:MAG: DUF1573 domain-containing protein [Thermodesulfobacteriota bacterium]